MNDCRRTVVYQIIRAGRHLCRDGAFDGSKQLKSNSWQEYVEAVYNDCRDSKECVQTPMIVYASKDGGYTWEERGGMGLPAGMDWSKMWEPHMVELDDGTLFASIRVESETVYGFGASATA